MITIKNAKELTPRQWYLFLKLYRKYFTSEVAKSNCNPIYSKLCMYLTAGGLSESSLSGVKEGSLISYVALGYDEKENGEVPEGFITGFETPEGIMKINDLYSSWDFQSRRIMISSLYRTMRKRAVQDGMLDIQMYTNDLMPKRTDDLNSLGFNITSEKGNETVYQSYIIRPKE